MSFSQRRRLALHSSEVRYRVDWKTITDAAYALQMETRTVLRNGRNVTNRHGVISHNIRNI